MDNLNFDKYTTPRKRGATSERAEIADLTAQLLKADIKKVLGWTRHLQPDQIYRLYKEANNTPQFWWTIYRQKYSKNNMEQLMIQKLQQYPTFRERSQRGIYLTKWALRDTGLLEKQSTSIMMTMNELSTFAIRYASLERGWRDCLLKHPELRGNDYEEKADLEEKKLKELRYRK